MKSKTLFNEQKGQALTELVIVMPLCLMLLVAPLTFKTLMGDRLVSDHVRLEIRLADSQTKEKGLLNQLKNKSCSTRARGHNLLPTTRWPENVDSQSALSKGFVRVGCLGEATARLGPKVALPLWTLFLQAPTEPVAKAASQTLCPRIKGLSEKTRAGVLATHRLRQPYTARYLINLNEQSALNCSVHSISARLLDRFVPAILDR